MKTLLLIMAIIFCNSGGAALADEVGFTWEQNPPPLEGYKLYQDDGAAPILELGPEVTLVYIEEPTDGKEHVFWLTAYNGAQESGPSDKAEWTPPGMIKVSGFLKILIPREAAQ